MNIVSMAQEWLDQQSFGIGGREQREMYQCIIDGAERDLLAYMSILKKKSAIEMSDQKRPVGRPKTITDMKAYKAAKAREYRSRAKEDKQK